MRYCGLQADHETITMKRIAFFFVVALLLCSCRPDSQSLSIADGESIIPLREAGDTTEVYLTDYVPAMDLSQLGPVNVTAGYDSMKVVDGVLTLYGSASRVGVLSIGEGDDRVDIPILQQTVLLEATEGE